MQENKFPKKYIHIFQIIAKNFYKNQKKQIFFNQNIFYFLILGEPPARDFSRRISTDASQPKLIVLPLSPNQPTTSTPPKSFSGSPPSRLVSPPQRAPPPYPHPPPPPAPVIYNNGPPKMVRKQNNKPD